MGEAKEKSRLGTAREIHVFAMERLDLAEYFAAEQRGGRPGWMAADRGQRRALRGALEQLGALEIWRVRTQRAGDRKKMEMPLVEMREVSTDSIAFLLGALGNMTGTESLALIDLEDRLEAARDGSYRVPEEVAAKLAQLAALAAESPEQGLPEAARDGV